jgi:hypothetical protein
MAVQASGYPVTYSLDEPASLSRWLWLFKGLLIIPHLIVLWVLGFVSYFVSFFMWIAILITGKRPRGLFDFTLGVNRWSMRVIAYYAHMTDRYPPFSMDDRDDYPMRLTAEFDPSANRLTTFFRWILAIPHWIIVGVLGFVSSVVMFIHIIYVVIFGKPHPEMFKLLVGINRWTARETLYSLLITDQYPPFSLD